MARAKPPSPTGYGRSTRRAVVAAAAAAFGVATFACARPSVPVLSSDPASSWIASAKLHPDVRVFAFRFRTNEMPFAFAVQLSAPLGPGEAIGACARDSLAEPSGASGESVAATSDDAADAGATVADARNVILRCPVGELASVVDDRRVVGVRCAPRSPPTAPTSEAWRDRVDPEVRTIVAANGTCWVSVLVRYDTEASLDDRDALVAHGAEVVTFDAHAATAFVPIRAIPAIAELPHIRRIDPPPK